MRILSVLLVSMLALPSCSNPKMEKIDGLKKEAITVHDIVMPRMGEIHELKESLKSYRKENATDTSDSARTIDGQIRDQILSLDIANEAMMGWMAEYEVDYEKTHKEDTAIAYYKEQVELIKEVKLKMEESIDGANEFLETFED